MFTWSLKLYLYLGAAVVIIALTVRVMTWREQANQNKVDWASVKAHLADESKSHTVGMDLEYGLNKYRSLSLDIDKEVTHAAPTSPRFDADSLRRTQARIAAGEAARQ